MSRRTMLARVYEEPSHDGGRPMRFVKADSPVELGVAAFTICQAIVEMRVAFDPETRRAAEALMEAIAGKVAGQKVIIIEPQGGGL